MDPTLFFFVLTLAASAAARPSDSNLNSEQDKQKDRIVRDTSFMLNDQRLGNGQLYELDKAAVNKPANIWPGGVIPYEIVILDFSLETILNIWEAMDHIEQETEGCVEFVPRTLQKDYLRIFAGTGCWSSVGKVGGKQDLSLGEDICWEVNGIVHELAHALCFVHEHQRPDRDQYIIIHPENIKPDLLHNFDKIPADRATTGEIYDFGSIMHYNKGSASTNGKPTMTPINNTAVWPPFSTKTGFSQEDTKMAKRIYC